MSNNPQNDKQGTTSELPEMVALHALLRDLKTTLDQQVKEVRSLALSLDQLKRDVGRLSQGESAVVSQTTQAADRKYPKSLADHDPEAVNMFRAAPGGDSDVRADSFRGEKLRQQILIALCAVCMMFSLWAVTVGWHHTIFDNHGFRQAQTAITTYYFRPGHFLSYETPVLGPPWSIPFEFPLYQALVATTAKILPIGLDQAGRLISVLFFYSTFLPFFVILRARGASRMGAFVTLALFAISPFYLFWSRTFMIESTALFLAACYLALVCSAIRADWRTGLDRWLLFSAVAVVGSLAGVTKITTFAAFWMAGAALVLAKLWTGWKSGYIEIRQAAIFFAITVLVPVIFSYGWTVHTDALKTQNAMGVFLTSHNLHNWNFGTLHQRLSVSSYSNYAFMGIGHVIDNLTGNRFIVVLSVALLVGLGLRSLRLFLISLALYLSAIAMFFNLHVIHTYYAYANGIFLIAAIGFVLDAAFEDGPVRRWAATAIFALAMAASINQYFREYYKVQDTNAPGRPLAAALIDRETNADKPLLLYGLDWSSELPYQARRRAIMAWTAPGEEALRHEIANLGADHLGALVVCDKDRSRSSILATSIRSAGFTAKREFTADNCDIYLP